MKILITGGAGYKGNILARTLLQNNQHQVTVFDTFNFGFTPVLDLITNRNCRIIKKDICSINPDDVKNQDVIYHLAANSGLPACQKDPVAAYEINVEGTKRLVKLLSPQQVLVYASTTSFYGKSGKIQTEDSHINTLSVYGQTKYQAENIVMQRTKSVSLRFATLFGTSPAMRTDLLVNNFVYRAVKDKYLVIFDPNNIRTYLHISDAISAYLLVLAKSQKMAGQIFNVGSNELNFSKLELARKIRECIDFEIFESHANDIDQRNFIINYDKINKLGFKAKKGLEEGIRELIKLYTFYNPVSELRNG